MKTRLCPPCTPADAADLHGAFVRDVVARHQRVGRRTTVWRAGDADHPLWGDLGVPLARQRGGDLGARMAAAFADECGDGARVVVLGTDSPSLPPSLVDAAFEALAHVPCVLGPACDGGYYLLGARGSVPPVFDDMPWGSAGVLPRTLAALRTACVPVHLLPFWYDVDRPADLDLLRAHLPVLAALGEPAPMHTMAWLEAHHAP